MSVLVKLIEERAAWCERNHMAEVHHRKMVQLFKLMGLAGLAALGYLYHVQIEQWVQMFLMR